MPTCEQYGLCLAIHPDDPPRSILGLPRILSSLDDFAWLIKQIPSKQNGLTMCTGSFGVSEGNNLLKIFQSFADRIYFIHLRSTQREADSLNFYEANHLEGDVDMYAIVLEILKEEKRRADAGDLNPIPMRPDHGHQMLDDLNKKTNPGYSAIGRFKRSCRA